MHEKHLIHVTVPLKFEGGSSNTAAYDVFVGPVYLYLCVVLSVTSRILQANLYSCVDYLYICACAKAFALFPQDSESAL